MLGNPHKNMELLRISDSSKTFRLIAANRKVETPRPGVFHTPSKQRITLEKNRTGRRRFTFYQEVK
jgi:hypothetical protein